MGISADVFVAVKHNVYNILSNESRKLLHSTNFVSEQIEGMAFLFQYIKPHELEGLYDELQNLPETDYGRVNDFIVVEANHEYPDLDDHDIGGWHDNPWNAHKDVVVSINLELEDTFN